MIAAARLLASVLAGTARRIHARPLVDWADVADPFLPPLDLTGDTAVPAEWAMSPETRRQVLAAHVRQEDTSSGAPRPAVDPADLEAARSFVTACLSADELAGVDLEAAARHVALDLGVTTWAPPAYGSWTPPTIAPTDYQVPVRRPPELDTLAEELDAEALRYTIDLIGAHTHAPAGDRGAGCPACAAAGALRHAASITRRWARA